jgi:O-methyltransferase
MRNFRTDLMFMINGPGEIGDKARRLAHAIDEIRDVTSSGLFASDCLVTWAKSMGFLADEKFVASLNGLLSNNPQFDTVVVGTVWRKHLLCWAATQCLSVAGDYVELGCYRGDTVKMVIDYTGFGTTGKGYWLYDLFENDGTISEQFPGHSADLYKDTVSRFSDLPTVRVFKGQVPASFDQGAPQTIALMHIDMNNAPSERAALEAFYDRVQPGGMIIFDDYGWVQYAAQKATIDEFMGARGKSVLELPTGQGLVIR